MRVVLGSGENVRTVWKYNYASLPIAIIDLLGRS